MSLDLHNLVPHRAPMLLIEKIVEHTPTRVVAGLTIHENTLGLEDGAVPAWFGVEYMAQTVAAFNGANFKSPDAKPEIGFLVGVRGYNSPVESFKLGSEITVTVESNFVMENSGSFDCKIAVDGVDAGGALITTYKPDAKFMESLSMESTHG